MRGERTGRSCWAGRSVNRVMTSPDLRAEVLVPPGELFDPISCLVRERGRTTRAPPSGANRACWMPTWGWRGRGRLTWRRVCISKTFRRRSRARSIRRRASWLHLRALQWELGFDIHSEEEADGCWPDYAIY
jgi:hypothetical protein